MWFTQSGIDGIGVIDMVMGESEVHPLGLKKGVQADLRGLALGPDGCIRFLLDTDTCIFALRHHLGVRFHFEAVTPAEVAISAMNEAELWQGALNSRQPDARDEKLTHLLRRIPEHGNRMLRLVIDSTQNPTRVITLFFDRKASREMP